VDVNSGVKGNDGFKNLQRLQAFIRSALSGTSS
jgi:phosphoribosylanthranilate isomerase